MTCRPNALRLFAPALLTCGLALPAAAVTLNNGDSILLPGTTLAQRPDLLGTTVQTNSFTLVNSDTPGAFSAKLDFGVIKENSGDIALTYRVEGSTIDTPLLWKVGVENLASNVTVDTGVLLDSPGTQQTITASRDANGVITFSSDTPLQPGQSTQTIFIHLPGITDFRQAGTITLTTDFGREPDPPGLGSPNGTFGAAGYAPVPEPAVCSLLLLGLAGLGIRYRRA
jgi:hypothetical protein